MAALLMVAACGKASNDSVPDVTGNASTGVAFSYGYAFELPSRSISELQEMHAQACERAGAANCRITGLSYTVDRDGEAHASLSVKVAANMARRFGRDAVRVGDDLGATLVGAEITGEDVQPAVDEADADRRTANADIESIDASLTDPRLSFAERTRLREQRAERVATTRERASAASSQRQRLASTPLSFTYQPGNGVGFSNALRNSADAAVSSTRITLIAITWLVASFGPPAIALLLLWLAWRRWGLPLRHRLTDDPA